MRFSEHQQREVTGTLNLAVSATPWAVCPALAPVNGPAARPPLTVAR